MLRNTSSSASLDALERASSANQPTITTIYQRARGSDTRACVLKRDGGQTPSPWRGSSSAAPH
jgi:hypothetical protein